MNIVHAAKGSKTKSRGRGESGGGDLLQPRRTRELGGRRRSARRETAPGSYAVAPAATTGACGRHVPGAQMRRAVVGLGDADHKDGSRLYEAACQVPPLVEADLMSSGRPPVSARSPLPQPRGVRARTGPTPCAQQPRSSSRSRRRSCQRGGSPFYSRSIGGDIIAGAQ